MSSHGKNLKIDPKVIGTLTGGIVVLLFWKEILAVGITGGVIWCAWHFRKDLMRSFIELKKKIQNQTGK